MRYGDGLASSIFTSPMPVPDAKEAELGTPDSGIGTEV